jgi:hypothetical protein
MPKGSVSKGFFGLLMINPESSHCTPTNGFVSLLENMKEKFGTFREEELM